MGYRLIQDETLPRGLKRIAREEIDSAIDQLGTKDQTKLDAAIHEARKSIKKVRGLMRMIAPVLGPSSDTDVAALGLVGRSLTELRDAAALVEAADLLSRHTRDAHNIEQLAGLRKGLQKRGRETMERADVHIVCEQAIMSLRHLKRGISAWSLVDSFDALAPGLRKSFRRGRKALRLVRAEETADNFHSLRKRVKDRWYQVRILESLWSGRDASPEKALSELQDDLGDDHNLNELRSFIPAECDDLLSLLEHTQNNLRNRSLDAAAALYASKPEAIIDELRARWDEWRPAPTGVESSSSAPRRSRSAA